MRLLLDTHAFLWFIGETSMMSERSRRAVEDARNDVLLSVASVWELAIKASIGKIDVGEPLDDFLAAQVETNRILLLDVTARHALAVRRLPFHHRDPFDRLLVAQAQCEALTVVSHDEAFARYDVPVLW